MSFAHFIFFGSSSPCGRERIQAEEEALRCRGARSLLKISWRRSL
jgi:hypothetical protein